MKQWAVLCSLKCAQLNCSQLDVLWQCWNRAKKLGWPKVNVWRPPHSCTRVTIWKNWTTNWCKKHRIALLNSNLQMFCMYLGLLVRVDLINMKWKNLWRCYEYCKSDFNHFKTCKGLMYKEYIRTKMYILFQEKISNIFVIACLWKCAKLHGNIMTGKCMFLQLWVHWQHLNTVNGVTTFIVHTRSK